MLLLQLGMLIVDWSLKLEAWRGLFILNLNIFLCLFNVYLFLINSLMCAEKKKSFRP